VNVSLVGTMTQQHWIGVVSRSHVLIGVNGGFVQLNHGKRAPLARMKKGDRLAMYSPRESYPDGPALQAFTALGVVQSGDVYQVEMAPDFKPYRVDVNFVESHDAAIKPLVQNLSFIKNKTHWGAAFRFGYIKVPEADFLIIAQAMQASFPSQGAS
jgi:EVE domain